MGSHEPRISTTRPSPSSYASSIHHLTTPVLTTTPMYSGPDKANTSHNEWSGTQTEREGWKYFISNFGIHNLMVEKFRTFDLYVFRCNMFRNPLLECQMHGPKGVSFVAHSYSTYYSATGCGLPRCELNWVNSSCVTRNSSLLESRWFLNNIIIELGPQFDLFIVPGR